MNKEKVFIEGHEVGFLVDTTGAREKKIQVASGDIVSIDERFIYKSIEREKVTIPQFVADWISYAKGCNKTLHYALENSPEKVNLWLCENELNRQNVFARAWLDGYEVEKEKKYKVVLLNYNDGHLNLVNVRTLGENIIFFTKKTQFDQRSLKLTKAEIISSGFGWIFDCPGIQIEEVE